jgi:hypothetical protein
LPHQIKAADDAHDKSHVFLIYSANVFVAVVAFLLLLQPFIKE